MGFAALTEIKFKSSVIWKDTQGSKYVDTSGVDWFSATIIRTSAEGFAGDNYWDNHIISFTPPQYTLAKSYGGYCKLAFGDMEFDIDMFAVSKDAGNSFFANSADVTWVNNSVTWIITNILGVQSDLWPMPVELFIKQQFTESDEGSLVLMFDGSLYLQSYDRESVSYDLYSENYDQDLLDEDKNYDDETVTLPRAFGAVVHGNPLRLPDSGGKPTYHKAYIAGTAGIDWHVFDDGVDIDGNVIDNGDDFSLSATPVGEVTISGTGECDTLSEIMTWACDATRLGLSYAYDSAIEENPSPSVQFWASGQTKLINFLSEIFSFFNHLFYVNNATMVVVSMVKDNGSRTITEYDYYPPKYEYDPPISKLISEWVTRVAVDETIGKYIKNEDHDTDISSPYPYGDEINITPFLYDLTEIKTRLEAIQKSMLAARVRIQVPISSNLPVPGESITFTDTSFKANVNMTMTCQTLRYDFKNDVVEIEGEGVIT